MFDRHDLTGEEWARLEPLLPDRTPCRGGRWMDHRMVIPEPADQIRHRAKRGTRRPPTRQPRS